jgi:hypothetical protein
VLILGGLIYPALVQSLIVRPNQAEREAPYIERNVFATRAAMGIDDVDTEPVQFSRLSSAEVESDLEPIRNVRLLNPSQMLARFSFDRGEVAGLKIDDLDVDRYVLDGEREQVLVSARELDLRNIPNKSWQGEHLVSTRGCGLVMAPVGRVTDRDRPTTSTCRSTVPSCTSARRCPGTPCCAPTPPRAPVATTCRTRVAPVSTWGASSGEPCSRWVSSTTTSSGRVRSTATRRSCGTGRCSIGPRSSHRSSTTTATRIRSCRTARWCG